MKRAASLAVIGLLLGIVCFGCAETGSPIKVEVRKKEDITFNRPFTTDGCSAFPDGTTENPTLWQACCIRHDKDYFIGGEEQLKNKADEELRQCIVKVTGSKLLGDAMFVGVQNGGLPTLPTTWRWGYGRGWSGTDKELGYATPLGEEITNACRMLKTYDEPYSMEQQIRKRIDDLVAEIEDRPLIKDAVYDVKKKAQDLTTHMTTKVDHRSYTPRLCETQKEAR